MCLQRPFHQGLGAGAGFLAQEIFFQIAPIPKPINAKCEFRISQSEIRNPQFSNDSHSHRELLASKSSP
jgi:hypothetical protein